MYDRLLFSRDHLLLSPTLFPGSLETNQMRALQNSKSSGKGAQRRSAAPLRPLRHGACQAHGASAAGAPPGYPPLQLPALCSSGSDLRGLGAVRQLWKSDMSRVGKVCSVNLKRRFDLTWIISLTIMLLSTPACILLQKMLTKPFQWVTSRTNFESLVHYKYSIKFNFTSVYAAAAHSLRSRSFAWCSQ